MELYTLDSLLRRQEVIDKFESLIWTERYSAFGDFSIEVESTNATRALLSANTRLALDKSFRVMTCETVTDSGGLLKVEGRSLEAILLNRIVKETLSNTTVEPKWVLTGTPGEIVRKLFNDICVLGTLNAHDKIPFITPGTPFPASNIPEPTPTITVEIPLKSLYDAIKELCDIYDLGFRLCRYYDTSKLYFDVYTGRDHTTQQTILPAIVGSLELDNLRDATELTQIGEEKNVAYVFSPAGFEVVYADMTSTDVDGFERKVLVVEATDIKEDADPIEASAAMIQKGKEELLKNRSLYALDGELDPSFSSVYGTDYDMGDLITMQGANGMVNSMKVTEQIFVSDREGERAYPTLSTRAFITPGSWLGWQYNQVWQDLGTSDFWSTA
jgi:uncharacterized protein YrzB (UPF0473 family)